MSFSLFNRYSCLSISKINIVDWLFLLSLFYTTYYVDLLPTSRTHLHQRHYLTGLLIWLSSLYNSHTNTMYYAQGQLNRCLTATSQYKCFVNIFLWHYISFTHWKYIFFISKIFCMTFIIINWKDEKKIMFSHDLCHFLFFYKSCVKKNNCY